MVVDCGNGAASGLAPELFERLGARVAPLFASPDGRNINLGCGALHVEKLRETVLAGARSWAWLSTATPTARSSSPARARS